MAKEIVEKTGKHKDFKGLETTISFNDGLNFENKILNEIYVETYLYEVRAEDKKEIYRTIAGSRIGEGCVLLGPDQIVSRENAFSHHFAIVNNFKKIYLNQF